MATAIRTRRALASPTIESPCRVVKEEQRKSSGHTVALRYQAGIEWVRTKSVLKKPFFCSRHRVRFPLVGGQCSNECQDLRNIRRGRCSNRGLHPFILECDQGHMRPRPLHTTMVRSQWWRPPAINPSLGVFATCSRAEPSYEFGLRAGLPGTSRPSRHRTSCCMPLC